MKLKHIYLFLWVWLLCTHTQAQCVLTIAGSTQVTQGQTATYSFSGGPGGYTGMGSANWAVEGYTTTYPFAPTATITWHTAGTFKLTALATKKFMGSYCGELWVTVTSACPSPPTATYTPTYAGCAMVLNVQNPDAALTYKWYTRNKVVGNEPITYTQVGTGSTYNLANASSRTLYLTATKAGCPETTHTPVVINTIVAPIPTVNGINRSLFVGTSITMQVTNIQSGMSYSWWKDGVQVGTGTTHIYAPTTGEQAMYVVKMTPSCANATPINSENIIVTAHLLPNIQSTKSPENGIVTISRGETATLVLNQPNPTYFSYTWFRNNLPVANNSSHTPLASGTYKVVVAVNDNGISTSRTSNEIVVHKGTDGQDMNYIISRTMLKEGITQESQIDNLLPAEIQEQIVYFDGLGRDIQAVITQGSPTGKDIIQLKQYDAFGREPKAYLPYTGGGNTGRYQADALTKQATFYNQDNLPVGSNDSWKAGNDYDLPQTLYPYSETVFENSPLNRPLEKGAVGKAWQVVSTTNPALNKTIKTKERALQTGETVIKWQIGYGHNDVPQEVGVYQYDIAKGSPLWVAELTDEHNNKTIEYKNGQGQVILKKVQSGTNTYTETYYVYDDFGNLRYVIPPLAVVQIKNMNNPLSNPITNSLCFRYVYDARKRMIKKQVPSGGEVRMVYDLLDRPILTQDAKQAFVPTNAPNNLAEWTLTKYDKLGRPVLTALYKTAETQETLQTQASNHAGLLYEKITTEQTFQYYTANTSYPAIQPTDANFRLLSATYYDDYNWNINGNTEPVYDATLGNELNPNSSPIQRIQGQVTATVVRKLEQNIWSTSNPAPIFISTVSFYDERYRVIQTQTENVVGATKGLDVLCTQYDFAGKVMKTLQYHSTNNTPPSGAGGLAVYVRSRTDYNHVGQPLKVYHKINNQNETTIAEMRYNELGTLVEKKVGKDAQGNPLQIVNFRHNIRGWLTHINDATLSEAKDLFGVEYAYEQTRAFNGVNNEVAFNGNITAMLWKSASDRQQRAYTYSYDALNRLKNAYYHKIGETETNPAKREDYSVLNMQYDVNGNIIRMERKGVVKIEAPSLSNLNGYVYGQIDNLTYQYNGNRLVSVNDQATLSTGASADFRDNGSLYNYNTADSQEQHEYQYDLNGSLEKDKNKKINSIIYNHLGLATIVMFENGDKITTTYDAAGVKLSKLVEPFNGNPQDTDYVGGFIYEGGQLQHFATGEGRVLAPSTSGNADYVYEYHYKDHLGNLRLAYREGKPTTPWKATMDAVNAPTEEREFANLTLTRDASKKRGATGESCRVNTAENKPIGAWKSIPVTQGDKVKAKVFSHYVANANNNNASSLFLALGGNALAYGSQTLPTGETKLPPSPFTNLTVGLSSLLTQNPSSTSLPKAYLAIIQYNENNQIVGQAQISYVTTASLSTTWQEHHAEFTATTNGRIEVFVANESNTNVWFDDLEVALTGTMIVQETHYDPWGMELVGIGKKGDNRFKFMGKETESNFDLNWIETDWRGYDAQLGRFHQVDKLAENMMDWTAYHYAFNNPIRLNDPSGLMPEWLQEIWDNSKSGDNWVNDNNGGFVKTNQNSQKKAEPKAQSLTVKKLREIASQNGVTDLLQIGAVFEQAFIEASKGYVRYNDKPNEDNDYTIIEFENNVRTAKVRPDGLGPTATRQGMGYINLVQNSAFYEIKSGYTLLDANYSQDNPKQLLAMLDALSQSEAHQYGNATLFLVTPVGVVVDLTTEAKRYGVNLIQITPTLLDDGKISFNKATFHYVVPNRGAIKAELSMKAFSTPVELKW